MTSLKKTNDQRLTTTLKERLQQLGATTCQDAAADFHSVVQLRVIQRLHHRLNRARLGIVGAIDKATDPGMHYGAGTHGARFNCNKQLARCQTMVADGCTGWGNSGSEDERKAEPAPKLRAQDKSQC